MGAFEGEVLSRTVAVAKAHRIEPQALLAVVEVESAGKSMEMDGKTPCLLFERHIFYRELKKAGKTLQLARAEANGLAVSAWSPSTQYKDEGTSEKRPALFNRAANIDEECAIRSCSWGVGQTMGFLAEEMKFTNARAMLAYMRAGGVPAQVECMVREIENKSLGPKLNAHSWAAFAKVYNGPGYATNHYDTKMAAAYIKWSKATLPSPADLPPAPKPKTVTPERAGVGAGIAAAIAGAWAAIKNLDPRIVIFGAFVLILLIATAVVIWRRRREPVMQLGTLASVEEVVQ